MDQLFVVNQYIISPLSDLRQVAPEELKYIGGRNLPLVVLLINSFFAIANQHNALRCQH